jgi:hypothetical protein
LTHSSAWPGSTSLRQRSATELYSSRQPRPAGDAAAGDVAHRVDDSKRSFADGRYERDQRIINGLFGLWTVFAFVAVAIAWHVDLVHPS